MVFIRKCLSALVLVWYFSVALALPGGNIYFSNIAPSVQTITGQYNNAGNWLTIFPSVAYGQMESYTMPYSSFRIDFQFSGILTSGLPFNLSGGIIFTSGEATLCVFQRLPGKVPNDVALAFINDQSYLVVNAAVFRFVNLVEGLDNIWAGIQNLPEVEVPFWPKENYTELQIMNSTAVSVKLSYYQNKNFLGTFPLGQIDSGSFTTVFITGYASAITAVGISYKVLPRVRFFHGAYGVGPISYNVVQNGTVLFSVSNLNLGQVTPYYQFQPGTVTINACVTPGIVLFGSTLSITRTIVSFGVIGSQSFIANHSLEMIGLVDGWPVPTDNPQSASVRFQNFMVDTVAVNFEAERESANYNIYFLVDYGSNQQSYNIVPCDDWEISLPDYPAVEDVESEWGGQNAYTVWAFNTSTSPIIVITHDYQTPFELNENEGLPGWGIAIIVLLVIGTIVGTGLFGYWWYSHYYLKKDYQNIQT